jgi:hypothetical protein
MRNVSEKVAEAILTNQAEISGTLFTMLYLGRKNVSN